MKHCKKCDTTKPTSEFHKMRTSPDGFQYACIECRKGLTLYATYEYKRNLHLKSKYGITNDDYALMLEKQNGRCAICDKEPEGYQLSVDHDHSCCPGEKSCGKCVRALLCQSCNMGIGYLHDNPDRMMNAATYILSFRNMLEVVSHV